MSGRHGGRRSRFYTWYLDAWYLLYLLLYTPRLNTPLEPPETYVLWDSTGDYRTTTTGSLIDCPFCGDPVNQFGCDRRDINWAPMHRIDNG